MTPQPDPNALEKVRRRLVVSCQAYPGEPMRSASIMGAVAESAIIGGAQGIRAQGLEDLRTIRALTPLPLIGLVKRGDDGVFITPTLQDSLDCIAAGSDIVALDGTRRPRPDGHDLAENITAIHDAGALAMADCGSLADAEYALGAGADCIGTTLAGYTGERPPTEGPDFALISELVRRLPHPSSRRVGFDIPTTPRPASTWVCTPWWSAPRSRTRLGSRRHSCNDSRPPEHTRPLATPRRTPPAPNLTPPTAPSQERLGTLLWCHWQRPHRP